MGPSARVAPARGGRRVRTRVLQCGRVGQMSFYSADALPRAVTDLEGVLCAGGVLTLFGRGTAARLAIVLGTPPPVVEVPDGEVPDGEGPDGEGLHGESVSAPDVRCDQRNLVVVGRPAAPPHLSLIHI